MVSRVSSFAFSGIDVTDIDIQVNIMPGLPAFAVVGLADKSVSESRERVRSAISAMGLALPPKRVTVNLAPADLLKEGSHFDLPIALGLLSAMGVLPEDVFADYVVLGELALDGAIMPVNGILPAAIGAAARNKGIICPYANGAEAAWGGDLPILAPRTILELINHFKGLQVLNRPVKMVMDDGVKYPDMADIKGQESAKRALEIAAAGGHNMLMTGPPGSGKSMLASRLPGIVPPMSSSEMLEVSIINSIAGNLPSGQLTRTRPFRDPHHNCSMAAMVGGGTRAKPGEVTLAHRGILFLDELPEFPRQVLDSLRQPLEAKKVTVARVQAHITYPSDFQFVAAQNPCRCGYLDDASRACTKAPRCADDYQSKLSGPLLDRIDIHIDVPSVEPSEIYNSGKSENSATVAKRVAAVRNIQKERYKNTTIWLNSQADGDLLVNVCGLDRDGKELLEQAVKVMGLSMRAHNRVLKVARTIADMEGAKTVGRAHLAEALGYRQANYRKKISLAG